MPRYVYHLCRASFKALDGEGAHLNGGRWNSPGRPVVYTSSTLALAALEEVLECFPLQVSRTDAGDQSLDHDLTTFRMASTSARLPRRPRSTISTNSVVWDRAEGRWELTR